MGADQLPGSDSPDAGVKALFGSAEPYEVVKLRGAGNEAAVAQAASTCSRSRLAVVLPASERERWTGV